jgi:hypothetical protein
MGIQSISENKMAIQSVFEEYFGTPAREMVRTTDPDTSVAAALSVDSTQLEAMVYEIIAKYPNGCTSDEVMHHFPSHGVQTISPRFAPLIRKGFIYDTGERRRASSGRSQRVMKVVQK